MEIGFAHTSFKWTNNAKGKAAVIVVIVGVRNLTVTGTKYIYSNGLKKAAKNINPYLTEGSNLTLPRRSRPISRIPRMVYGNKSTDDGQYPEDNKYSSARFYLKNEKGWNFLAHHEE